MQSIRLEDADDEEALAEAKRSRLEAGMVTERTETVGDRTFNLVERVFDYDRDTSLEEGWDRYKPNYRGCLTVDEVVETKLYEAALVDDDANASKSDANASLSPAIQTDSKFDRGNDKDGKHYWLTPPALYTFLNDLFGPFDFDPCPYPRPEGFDSLTCEWGQRNYVNPPFGSTIDNNGKKVGPTAWVQKALEERAKGKFTVIVFPVDGWMHLIFEAIGGVCSGGGAIYTIDPTVKWLATEDGTPGPGAGRPIACFVIEPEGTKEKDAAIQKLFNECGFPGYWKDNITEPEWDEITERFEKELAELD